MVANRAHDRLYMTVEQYLQLDNSAADAKYEYLDGYAYLLRGGPNNLAGGTPIHALISMNVGIALGSQLGEGPCRVYSSDGRVQLAEKRYVYPDLTLSCVEQEPGQDNIQQPRVVVKVLSPSTQDLDRGEKLKAYRACPTIEDILLVSQDEVAVEVYHREGKFWKYQVYENGEVELLSIGVKVPIERLYRGVRF